MSDEITAETIAEFDPNHIDLDAVAKAAHAASETPVDAAAMTVGLHATMVGERNEALEARKALEAELADIEHQLATGQIDTDADSEENRTVYIYKCGKNHRQIGSGAYRVVSKHTGKVLIDVEDTCHECYHQWRRRSFRTRRTNEVAAKIQDDGSSKAEIGAVPAAEPSEEVTVGGPSAG